MNTWAPLWSGSPDSSLWDEPDFVFKVFMTMLAVKDADHIVRLSAYQIARKSRKTEQEVLEALRILSSPDSKRLEPQEHEGRRIKLVEEGWLLLNGEKYKQKIQEEMKRARNRRAQRAYRERKKGKVSAQYAGEEQEFVEAEQNGDIAKADEIAARPAERLEAKRCSDCGLLGRHESWCAQWTLPPTEGAQ